VLNNVTPFNQRMTDMMNNRTETAVSMLQQAGGPFTGDVALNQDNLTSVGLIQLYETILNKAETLSILLGPTKQAACQQLLLAVERLHDLYILLGDEAYTDAKNPTVAYGNNIATVENESDVDFSAVASSLFCFDNQVNSLLDEELCLLRGRSGVSAPSTHNAPYYNRLVWNFTKGITAGEVAYVVNYDINGGETLAMTEEQAARTCCSPTAGPRARSSASTTRCGRSWTRNSRCCAAARAIRRRSRARTPTRPTSTR